MGTGISSHQLTCPIQTAIVFHVEIYKKKKKKFAWHLIDKTHAFRSRFIHGAMLMRSVACVTRGNRISILCITLDTFLQWAKVRLWEDLIMTSWAT